MADATPNPGSPEAVALGCTCPRIDNGHGRGAYGGQVLTDDAQPMYWVAGDCPLHAPAPGASA